MEFEINALMGSIDDLCMAARMDLHAYQREISTALLSYEAPERIIGAFEAILADPAAKKHSPGLMHNALMMFMDQFMNDTGIKPMGKSRMQTNKRYLLEEKWNELMVCTLLGEVDVALSEGSPESIMGKPKTEVRKMFLRKHYGLRRRLSVHEDFMMPTLKDQAAKRDMSLKFIANFEYCREYSGDTAANFYDSLDAAVALAGAHYNVVEAHFELNGGEVPPHIERYLEALTDAVRRGGRLVSDSERYVSRRLHGLITRSAAVISDKLEQRGSQYGDRIIGLQHDLRRREQKPEVGLNIHSWERRDKKGPRY